MGRNPANQLIDGVFPLFTGFTVYSIHPRWCRISSINSITHIHPGAKWRLPGNTRPFHCQSFTGSETGDVQSETLILVDFLQTFDSLKFGDYVRILTLH